MSVCVCVCVRVCVCVCVCAVHIFAEKVFFLDPPKDVTLSCQMPLDEMDPGWLDEGRLQV